MNSNKLCCRATDRRGGYVLILVVLLLFGIMAMAALVIDLGYARLTQRQMQTAVDAAALEGLRYRDSLWPEASNPNSTEFDIERRNAASLTVARMFDDNLMADSEDPLQYGAGPNVEFSGGAGDPDMAASQDMTIPGTPVYKPIEGQQLRRNLDNEAEGDMLAGTYDAYDLEHEENAAYLRSDFVPAEDVAQSQTADAFLVRLRRSNEDFSNSIVASSGPSLPYLFARGSLFNRGNAQGQAKLTDGIQVRATGIAYLQPVVRIGNAQPNLSPPITGKINAAVRLATWTTLGVGESLPTAEYLVSTANTVGAEVISGGEPVSGPGYIALYESYSTGEFVVGFGYGQYDLSNPADVSLRKLSIVRERNQIAIENASAVFSYTADTALNGGSDLDSIIVANRALVTRDDILLVPVSGR